MSNLIFRTFNLGNNLIDDLFHLFEYHGFEKYKKIKSNLHEFAWPQIVLSNQKSVKDFKIFPDEIDDLYNREILFRDDRNYKRITDKLKGFSMELIGMFCEGDVYLFNLNLEKCAVEYYKKHKSHLFRSSGNLNDIINSLMEIVLIHEFVHFLTDNQNKIKYNSQDEIYYHEAIAQYFTYQLIKDNKLHRRIFEWLFDNQLKRYRVFREFDNFNENDVINEIKKSFKNNYQSFDNLMTNLKATKGNNKWS